MGTLVVDVSPQNARRFIRSSISVAKLKPDNQTSIPVTPRINKGYHAVETQPNPTPNSKRHVFEEGRKTKSKYRQRSGFEDRGIGQIR
jgi:cell division septation protein DedD